MKDYEVSITTEITYTVIVPAESEEEAEDIVWNAAPTGPCTFKFDEQGEEEEGYIHPIYSREDIVIENPDDEEELDGKEEI